MKRGEKGEKKNEFYELMKYLSVLRFTFRIFVKGTSKNI